MNLLSLLDLHNDIFDDIILPDGIDKETCIDTIIARNCTYDVMDHDYPLCKSMITLFFKNHYYQFDRFQKALDTDYDLIQNYDRTREYTRKVSDSGGTTSKTSDTIGENIENKTSAYNSSSYQPQNMQTTNSENNSSLNEQRNANKDETISEHEFGDLSVMSTTEKVKQELELRRNQKYNIYIFIADMFFTELCLRNA